MADEKRSPVGRIMATPKDKDRRSERVKLAAVWATPYDGNYNLTFGDRDVPLSEVLDIIESGDYFINVKLFDKDNDGF